jgi:hypothetical protein
MPACRLRACHFAVSAGAISDTPDRTYTGTIYMSFRHRKPVDAIRIESVEASIANFSILRDINPS